MVFAKHGDNCVCCHGPTAWTALYPLAPTRSIDSDVPSANSQPEIVKSGSKRDWLRLPDWALPTRATPVASADDDPPIPLDAILAGRTKSPIRVDDLRAFLRDEEQTNAVALRSLEFLLTYNSFRSAFFALPPEKQAPRPFAVLESFSLANKAAEIQSTFASIPSGELARPQATHAASALQTYPQLDPNSQPMRHEMQNVIDLYLQPHSLSPITSLVSPNTLRQALSQAKLTTHPSALDPVASNVHSYLTTKVLPRFLDHAVSNLSATTSRGRMLVACVAFAAAIVLEVFLILYRTGRAARLLVLPLWILAIGYAIGSRTGLCFWLVMRGTREHKSYEAPSPLITPSHLRFGASLAPASPEPQRPPTLLSRVRLFGRKLAPATATGDPSSRPDSMAEKGRLPSDIALGATIEDKRALRKLRKNQSGDYSATVDTESRASYASLTESVKWAVRLTGTAVDTVTVEDPRVRKLQALVGLRVAIWLFLGTSTILGITMAIP